VIPPLQLPSDPKRKIRLREATVNDCIEIAGADPDHEEEVTTAFLGRVLETPGEDPLKWTAEDRRLAIYWYWLHTARDIEIPVDYECPFCHGNHVYLQDGRDIAAEAVDLEGPAFREFEHSGETVRIVPLSGAAAEDLEVSRIGRKVLEDEGKHAERRRAEVMDRIDYLAMVLRFKDCDQENAKDFDTRKSRLLRMGKGEFKELAAKAQQAMDSMAHGLRTVYEAGRVYIELPVHVCPVAGGSTRIRFPFRCHDYIAEL